MKVLYLLGNGFDLNFGLPTNYTNFYKYYIDQSSSRDVIKVFKEELADNLENWADLEIELGKYTTKIKTEEEYIVLHKDLMTELTNYIQCIDKAFTDYIEIYFSDKLKGAEDTLFKPQRYFNEADIARLEGFNNSHGTIDRMDVVTFNYTSTFELLYGNEVNERLKKKIVPIHIHRKLKEGINLGVDNVEQIANQELRKSDDVKTYLVKPIFTEQLGELTNQKIKSIISNSALYCLFGLSLGETDRTWWNCLANELANKEKRLIFFYHSDQSFEFPHDRIVFERNYKKQIVGKLIGKNANWRPHVESKVFCVRNADIFKIEGLNLERDKFFRALKESDWGKKPFFLDYNGPQ